MRPGIKVLLSSTCTMSMTDTRAAMLVEIPNWMGKEREEDQMSEMGMQRTLAK